MQMGGGCIKEGWKEGRGSFEYDRQADLKMHAEADRNKYSH
jgi:hypothetical protein